MQKRQHNQLNQYKQHCYFYKITNDYNDDIYIGSTCNTLIKRFSQHKADPIRIGKTDYQLYALMNEIGFERFRIELVFDYPCEDKYQLCQKKSEYIRLYEKTLNLHGEDHKEKRKTQKEQNKTEIQIKVKADLEQRINRQKDKKSSILCACGCEILKRCLKTHQTSKKHIELMENQNSKNNSN